MSAWLVALLVPFQLFAHSHRRPVLAGGLRTAHSARLANPVGTALALQGAVDQGTLVIREDTGEVAREAFRLATVQVGEHVEHWKLATNVRYGRGRPVVVLSPALEVGPDSQPLSLEYDVIDPQGPERILGQQGRARFVVRTLGRRMERAREFALAGPMVVLDDSVFALYRFVAPYARPAPRTLTAIYPRSGRRETLTVQDLGLAATTLSRNPATLRHVIVTGGAAGDVHLWLASDGRLMKIEIPARHLSVERLPAA